MNCSGEHRLTACSFRQPAEKLCERSTREVFATCGTIVGKLPTTTGWQPVLPRVRSAILILLNFNPPSF